MTTRPHPPEESPIVSATDPPGAPAPLRRTRKLRPEVASEMARRNRQTQLDTLYDKPVQELDPDDIARMRRAFFRG
jgi:hypothetical protein